MFVTGGTASFTSCEFTSNSANTDVRLRPPRRPRSHAQVAAAAHPPNPALTALARLHASQGAVLYVGSSGTATFASTLPANSFSGNKASNTNYGNCYKERHTTITGSCD